jgi:hypothetical protein
MLEKMTNQKMIKLNEGIPLTDISGIHRKDEYYLDIKIAPEYEKSYQVKISFLRFWFIRIFLFKRYKKVNGYNVLYETRRIK